MSDEKIPQSKLFTLFENIFLSIIGIIAIIFMCLLLDWRH